MHYTAAVFWKHYKSLSPAEQKLADKAFELLQSNPSHPSLNFKRVKRYKSARVSRNLRAVAIDCDDGLLWIWIGNHQEYDEFIK